MPDTQLVSAFCRYIDVLGTVQGQGGLCVGSARGTCGGSAGSGRDDGSLQGYNEDRHLGAGGGQPAGKRWCWELVANRNPTVLQFFSHILRDKINSKSPFLPIVTTGFLRDFSPLRAEKQSAQRNFKFS